MEIKNSDFNQIQGWMTRIRVTDPDGTERTLSAYELLIFGKLYGFVQDNQGICRSQENYFIKWCGGADRKTVYAALKLFEANNLIIIKRYYDKNAKKTRNQYLINTSKILRYDDSKYLVKNESSITILPFQLDLPIKSYTSIVYALIHQYSKDGISTCKVSSEYLSEWCAGASSKTIKRIFDKLKESNLIDSAANAESPSGVEYWSTYSRSCPDSENGQNSPLLPSESTDKIPHCSGQNSPSVETKFPITSDKIPHLNSSINLSLKEVEVKEKITTTFSISQKLEELFKSSELPSLITEKSFITKLQNWYAANDPSEEIAVAYIKDTLQRFSTKKIKNPGLFVTMFESQSDYQSFLNRYEQSQEEQMAAEKEVAARLCECPICHSITDRYKNCSCGFDMYEINNTTLISETINIRKLSQPEQIAYQNELDGIWMKPEYSGMSCVVNAALRMKRDSEILSIKQKYGVVA